MQRGRSNWVVGITDADTGDTYTTGPYSRKRAEEIEAALEKFFDGYGDLEPLVSAYPLHRETIPRLKTMWAEYNGKKAREDAPALREP